MSQSIGLKEKGINFLKEWCNKVNPNIKFVSGGAKSWAWSQQNFKFFDYFILGYADATVVDLTNYLAGVNDTIKTIDNLNGSKSIVYDQKGEQFDFNNHTHIWHSSDHLQQGTALPIEIARGCIFKCSYCSYPLNGKKKNDFIRDPNKIVDELTYNYENFGTTHYMYSDDTHNDSVEKLEFLYNNVYSKLPFKIKFSTYLRLDLLAAHPHTIDLLKESGLVGTFFGIESFNPEANKLIGKHATEERIYENLYKVKEVWKDDVIVNVGLILGLTNDSIDTCTKWLDKITDKDSPINWAAIAPLQINQSKNTDPFFQNKIELNTADYGYTFDNNGVWTNNKGMTQYDAEQLKTQFDKKLSEQKTIKFWYDPHRAKELGVSDSHYYTLPSESLVSIENNIVERYFNDLLQ